MTADRDRLARLAEMAAMVFDAKARRLQQENAARDALRRQLAEFEAPATDDSLPWTVQQMTRFGYETWATARRAEINLKLAAQTVECLKAADETRLALGRQLAVERIGERRKPPQLS